MDGQRTKHSSDKIPGETEANRSLLKMKQSDLKRWQESTDGEVFIFTRVNFWNDVVPIKAITFETGQVELNGKCSYVVRPGDRYFIQGMREELDAPGEWYLDRKTRQLMIYSTADPATMVVEVAVAPILIGTRQRYEPHSAGRPKRWRMPWHCDQPCPVATLCGG